VIPNTSSIAADPQYEAIFEKTNCFHWCDKEEIRTVGVLVENNVEEFIRRGAATTYAF
jgi:hypothetical protein